MKQGVLWLGSLLGVLFVGLSNCQADEIPSFSCHMDNYIQDSSTEKLQSVSQEDVDKLFSILVKPYKDDLGFELRDELSTKENRLQLKRQVEQSLMSEFAKRLYVMELDRLSKQIAYVEKNKELLLKSVQTLSELGDPADERQRAEQSFKFDNLDATGFFVKPGRVANINVYVDSKEANKVFLVAQSVGKTDNDQGSSLKKQVFCLQEGLNRISLNLEDAIYGKMLYLRNNAGNVPAKVRIESADAYETGTVEGSNLGRCPVFIYDGKNADQFYQYIQDIKKYVEEIPKTSSTDVTTNHSNITIAKTHTSTTSNSVQEHPSVESPILNGSQDMTVLQLGHTQMELQATVIAKIAADEKLDTKEACQTYIEKAFQKSEERVELLNHYAGFSKEESGVNTLNPMRVCINFTSTVKKPSTMYASDFYYHLPAEMAEGILNGKEVYSWATCHEYGHMLDCKSLVLAEHTNNLYAIWGRRHQAIEKYEETGDNEFNHLEKIYHPQIAKQTDNMFLYLKNTVSHQPTDDIFNKHNKFYHTLCWFLGTHYFDNWDYSTYDFTKSPYTKELVDDVKKYGTYGTALRIMRSKEGQKIEAVTQNHYYRMVLAFTEACGYNFAKYMEKLGEVDIPEEIKIECAKYPDMPRKVEYYSLIADGKQITKAKPYEKGVKPVVSATKISDNQTAIKAEMSGDSAQYATVMYELYDRDQLIDLSRDGQFFLNEKTADFDKTRYSVIAYDCFLNPSDKGEIK